MSRTKSLIHILGACEKHEFDQVVKSYLKEIYNFKRIVMTDGNNDTGIDIKIFDLNGEKIQYQLTVQKSQSQIEKNQFETKLFDDVKKAKINFDQFGYSANLFFFYSKELTNKAIREYKRKAKTDFGINLEIIDSNQLAEESEEFIELQKTIYETSGLDNFKLKESTFDDKSENLIYDLVGFGESANIKLQIVEAFILQTLFENVKLAKDQIVDKCKSKFTSKENKQFYDKLITRLQSEKKIKIEGNQYELAENELKRIKDLLERINLDDDFFLKQIHTVLKKYDQQDFINEYVQHLKYIYSNNFNKKVRDELDGFESDTYIISRDFTNFIDANLGKSVHVGKSKSLALELFKVCEENKYLQKTCASKVFSEQTNLNRLETYVNTKKKLFVDTSVALYSLCYFFDPKFKYDNFSFEIISSLLDYCKKNNLNLYIPEFYLWETHNHVRESINLIPFTTLPNFHKLGKSRNVFYNYYLAIYEKNHFVGSYEDFLNKFGFKKYNKSQKHTELINNYLVNLNIVEYKLDFEYDIEESIKLFQEQLFSDNKFKTKFGLNNDAIMLEFLCDNDIEVHNQAPLFITWDRTFFKIQKKMFENRPTCQRWHIFTPGQLLDHYALLNFKIDSETITKELIAYLSDDIIQSTHTLLDSLTVILNPHNEVGLEYTNKLADIRDNEIYTAKHSSVNVSDELEGEFVIDDVFFKLTSYYRDPENKSIELFQKIFTKKEYVNEVIDLINNTINHFYDYKKFDENIYSKFDNLIDKMIEDNTKE